MMSKLDLAMCVTSWWSVVKLVCFADVSVTDVRKSFNVAVKKMLTKRGGF